MLPRAVWPPIDTVCWQLVDIGDTLDPARAIVAQITQRRGVHVRERRKHTRKLAHKHEMTIADVNVPSVCSELAKSSDDGRPQHARTPLQRQPLVIVGTSKHSLTINSADFFTRKRCAKACVHAPCAGVFRSIDHVIAVRGIRAFHKLTSCVHLVAEASDGEKRRSHQGAYPNALKRADSRVFKVGP